MKPLIWKHGRSIDEVRQMMQGRLAAAGISDKVTWIGNSFTASIGWGAILSLVGNIGPDDIVLEKCSGALASVVRAKCIEAFQEMFPGGEPVPATQSSNHQSVLP